MDTLKIRAFGEELAIAKCLGGWQTTDGRVFPRALAAARHEIERLIIESGDDPGQWSDYVTAAAHTAVKRAEVAPG